MCSFVVWIVKKKQPLFHNNCYWKYILHQALNVCLFFSCLSSEQSKPKNWILLNVWHTGVSTIDGRRQSTTCSTLSLSTLSHCWSWAAVTPAFLLKSTDRSTKIKVIAANLYWTNSDSSNCLFIYFTILGIQLDLSKFIGNSAFC